MPCCSHDTCASNGTATGRYRSVLWIVLAINANPRRAIFFQHGVQMGMGPFWRSLRPCQNGMPGGRRIRVLVDEEPVEPTWRWMARADAGPD